MSKQELFYVIPGKPVTKKNSMQMVKNPKTGKWFPIPSKQYKAYEKTAGEHLDVIPVEPIDFPVNVRCIYHLERNKDGSLPKNIPDLTNLLEATDDILVKYGILKDDNALIVARHDGSRVQFDADQGSAYVKIEIYGLEVMEVELKYAKQDDVRV